MTKQEELLLAGAKIVLKEMDDAGDKDGKTSISEFTKAMVKKGFPEDAVKEVVALINTDKDDNISALEYIRLL